jgi:hypothetical protein
MNLARELDETRIAVCNIMNWLVTVTLHQTFRVGKSRLDRVAVQVNRLLEENMRVMQSEGTNAARQQRKNWVQGISDAEFRVPLIRAPKTSRERQLVMAGNASATLAWQAHCKACADVLGFGGKRLTQLKTETWKNYEQFNQWSNKDGMDVAMEQLRRCVAQALQDDVSIVEGGETVRTTEKEFERLLEKRREKEKSAVIAKTFALQNHTMIMNGDLILKRCNAELENVLYCNKTFRLR